MDKRLQKKSIITVAGKPGSGKSTTCKLLASALSFTHFSSGDLFRDIAKDRGVDVLEINLLAETERKIDFLVDQKLRDLGEQEDNLVIDSRMAWHWMPYSFRVYLDLDLEIAAARILSNLTEERMQAENIPTNPADYAVVLAKRLDSEAKRYNNLYNVNPYDTNNYDLVVNTNEHSPEEVTARVLKSYKKWRGE